MKKRSKIIKDLIMNNIDVLQAMQSLSFILDDIDNKEIKNWVNCELNGYEKNDIIPKYRKANTMLIGNVQVEYSLYKNINIPLADPKAIEMFNNIEIKESISNIMQMAKAENESENHSLALEVNTILVNEYQQTNGDVIHAKRVLSIYAYNNILATIKDKLLEIFKNLDNTYGNLDDLYIDFSNKEQMNKTIKELKTIVYNDNSVHMGSNNTIKNSIIGENNEN